MIETIGISTGALYHRSRIEYRVLGNNDDPIYDVIVAVIAFTAVQVVYAYTTAFTYAGVLVDNSAFNDSTLAYAYVRNMFFGVLPFLSIGFIEIGAHTNDPVKACP